MGLYLKDKNKIDTNIKKVAEIITGKQEKLGKLSIGKVLAARGRKLQFDIRPMQKLSVSTHAYNHNAGEGEAGRSLIFGSPPTLAE